MAWDKRDNKLNSWREIKVIIELGGRGNLMWCIAKLLGGVGEVLQPIEKMTAEHGSYIILMMESVGI